MIKRLKNNSLVCLEKRNLANPIQAFWNNSTQWNLSQKVSNYWCWRSVLSIDIRILQILHYGKLLDSKQKLLVWICKLIFPIGNDSSWLTSYFSTHIKRYIVTKWELQYFLTKEELFLFLLRKKKVCLRPWSFRKSCEAISSTEFHDWDTFIIGVDF